MKKLIVPPFTEPEQAAKKVQLAEDLRNTCDPETVAAAYTEDTEWRNRTDFYAGAKLLSNSSAASEAVSWATS